jgi:HlyD family secretion protein
MHMLQRLSQLLPKAFSSRTAVAAVEPTPLAVLEFQSPTAAIIALPVPFSGRYLNWFVTALVFSGLTASGVMPVDRLVVASGQLVSAAPDTVIQAFSSDSTASIIKSIDVQPGQIVHKGQILATLDPTYAEADLTSLTQQQQSYAAQVAQLQAQEDGKPYYGDANNPAAALALQTYNQQTGQLNSTVQYYDQQIGQLQTEIKGFNDQAAYYRQRLGIASNVETMRKDLQHLQVGSTLDTLAATDERVSMQASLDSAVSSALADEKQLASVTAQRDSAVQQWKASISQQLATALNSLYQAQQSLTKARLNNSLVVLTAPQDSIVQSIASVAVGTLLQSGQTFMDLTPLNAPLNIQVQIDGTEAGYVNVGNPVAIKVATLDYLHYGEASGTVTSISPESINPLNQAAFPVSGVPLPGAPQDLYYNAQVSIDVLNLHNVPPGFHLTPGMPVETDVKVGERTMLVYFAQRILPVAYQSMHEP